MRCLLLSVFLPGSGCVYPLHVEFQSPLTHSSVLHFCGRPMWQGRVWEKRKFWDQKMHWWKQWKERIKRGKERATKKYLLFPGERRWLFAENGGIISYFLLFLAHIWGATQYLCYWDTSEMHLSAAPPTYNGITVLGVFKEFKVIQPSSHLPLASCWTVKLLFVANLPSLALAGPLMSNTALIIIDSPQSVYQKDIWFLSVLFRKGNEVKWRFLLM